MTVPLRKGNNINLTKDNLSLGEGMTGVNYWMYGADPNFQESYRARWGQEARFLAAVTYNGLYVIADALKRAGSDDPEAIRKALVSTNLMTGMGRVKFDKNQQAYSNVYVAVLRGGKIELLDVIEQPQP